MLPDNQLRVSDRERDAVVALLGDHLAEGRIDLAEFEERSTRAGAARTRGELAELTEDLPVTQPAPATAPAAQPRPVSLSEDGPPARRGGGASLRPVARWLSVSVMCTAIWAVSSVASGHVQHFWPGWVIGGWGVLMLMRVLKGVGERD